jgi:hypothetical protein
MPSIGTPDVEHLLRRARAAASVVDSGPPERMMPFAPNAAISAGSWSQAQISQYTPISRMRRAISWVYCAPKSRMRILSRGCRCGHLGSCFVGFAAKTRGAVHRPRGKFNLLAGMARNGDSRKGTLLRVLRLQVARSLCQDRVVRRFLGDLHVVHVALALPAPVMRTNCGLLRMSSMVAQPV